MEFKRLGKSTVKIPVLGLGTWGMGGLSSRNIKNDHEAVTALRLGLQLEMSFVDTAEMYGSGHTEEVVAQALEGQRDSAFLATKVSGEHLSYDGVLKSCDMSLKRLETKYVDLYQVHWPNSRIPISETMRAMEQLVKDGKIRHVGVSNFSVKQTREAQEALSSVELVSNQVEYSLMERSIEEDLLPFAEQEKITVIAYSPLNRGLIPGNSNSEQRMRLMDQIASKYGKTRNQVALNWLIAKEPVVVIPKAANLDHVRENAGAQGWKLFHQDIEALNNAFK
ncbi:MAG: aldo/keto reductase [Candidatus Bathyarchaeia archaeon]|jgi:diketogulonate reductase-like aldo/keto reductase